MMKLAIRQFITFLSLFIAFAASLPPPGMEQIDRQQYDQVYHRYGAPGYQQQPYYFNLPNSQPGFPLGGFPVNQQPIYVVTVTSPPPHKAPAGTTETSPSPLVAPTPPSSSVMMTGTSLSPDTFHRDQA